MLSHVFALASTWQSYYANHAAIRTMVAFAHVASLIVGGGIAITGDRDVLRLRDRHPDERRSVLLRLRASHRTIVAALAIITLSGALLFASDLQTYAASTFFWSKMAFIALLTANGLFLLAAERRAFEQPDDRRWVRVRMAAVASASLWFLTTLIGVALPNVG